MNRLNQLSASLTTGSGQPANVGAALAKGPVTTTIEGKDQSIGVITMANAANLNAMNIEMRRGIIQAVHNFEKDAKIKVICLRSGIEKVFCAGANIKDMETKTYEQWILHDDFSEVGHVIGNCRKPIIAAIHKIAYGGGLEIALLCDIIIAAEDTKLGLPEIKLGLMPGIGGTLISKYIGKGPAMKMVLTGEAVTAQQALQMGLITEVHKGEELHQKQIELAEKIAQHSTYSLMNAKLGVKFSFENPAPAAFEMERRLFYSDFSLPGAKEGISSFIKKQKPDFRDK